MGLMIFPIFINWGRKSNNLLSKNPPAKNIRKLPILSKILEIP